VGPAIEWPRGAQLPWRRVVILANPGGHVSVLAQHFANRAAASRQDARVAIVACRQLRNTRERGRMLIAASDQCGPRRAAQRRGMKAIKPQAFVSQSLHRW